MPGVPDPLYVRARAGLLDAVEALGLHRESVVLVGAQAIYLHTGDADLAVAEYTTDPDFPMPPRELTDALACRPSRRWRVHPARGPRWLAQPGRHLHRSHGSRGAGRAWPTGRRTWSPWQASRPPSKGARRG